MKQCVSRKVYIWRIYMITMIGIIDSYSSWIDIMDRIQIVRSIWGIK